MTLICRPPQQAALQYFAKPLQGAALSKRIYDRAAGAFMSVRQYLYGIPDVTMCEHLKGRLLAELRLHGSPGREECRIPDSYSHCLLATQFKQLFRASAVAYFQKKIEGKKLSLEQLKKDSGVVRQSRDSASERLLPKTDLNTVEDFVSTLSFSKLVSLIPGEDRKALTLDISNPSWGDFWTVVNDAISLKGNRLEEVCSRHFLTLFTNEELQGPGSWKVYFAQRLVKIKEGDLPVFMQEKLRSVRQ